MKMADAFKELAGSRPIDIFVRARSRQRQAKQQNTKPFTKFVPSMFTRPRFLSWPHTKPVLERFEFAVFPRGTLYNAEICNYITLYTTAKTPPANGE